MSAELTNVAELLESTAGIRVKDPQLPSLASALGRLSPGMTAARFLTALSDSADAPGLLGQLIDQVAVQETYFLREAQELETIDWEALGAAAHLRGDSAVRVWICACASGEEAYSVAMLAIESFATSQAPVSILATDISERALHRAQRGIYNERSMREVDASRRERFFIERGRGSAVGEELRALVTFRQHNLVGEPATPAGEGPFDVILCRNVLIYFGAANVQRVAQSLQSALEPGGQLILGASDRLMSSAHRLAQLAVGANGPRQDASVAAERKRKQHARARRERRAVGEARRDPPASPVASKRAVSDAQAAANAGNIAEAIAIADEILARDPLDSEAHFVRGLTTLAAGDPTAASESLRRALYIDPSFALAAFQLGRAQDLCGDEAAAKRAYRRALSTLDNAGEECHREMPDDVHAGDVAAACRARLSEGRRRTKRSVVR
jgi:chemotaxis protein methyltransferase CheR